MAKQGIRYSCYLHRSRVAVVEKAGRFLCWERYLGKENFINRFEADFYDKKRAVK